MAKSVEADEYQVLLQASSAASVQVRSLERVLRAFEPQSLAGKIIYAELRAAAARETHLRNFVRSHPCHSYEGL